MDNEIHTPQHICNLLLAENKQLKIKNEKEMERLEQCFSKEIRQLNESWQKDYTKLQKKYHILMKLYKENL